jgi:potassium efflux system protein
MIRIFALLHALTLALALLGGATHAVAQDDPAATIEAARADLDRIEARLSDSRLDDEELAALRVRIDPMTVALETAISQLTPQLAAADARLAQIGPKPKEGEPAESAEVARERDAQAQSRKQVDEAIKRGRLLQVEATQVGAQITERRRALLASRLFERSRSLIDPALWLDVAGEASRDLSSIRGLGREWADQIARNFSVSSVGQVAVAVLAAVLLLFPIRLWVSNFAERLVVRQAPRSRLRRSATALFRLVATTLAPLLAALCVYLALKSAGWLPSRAEPLAATLVRGAGFLGFAHGMTKALFAPGRPSWRLIHLSDAAVAEIRYQPLWVALVFVLGRVVATFNGAVGASLSASVATAGVFAALNAATFAIALRRLRRAQQLEDAKAQSESEERYGHPIAFLARMAAFAAIATVLVSVVIGFVALAQFLANQVIWITAVIWLAYLLMTVVDDLFTSALSGETRFGRTLSDGLGVRASSLEQIGVLLSGVVRLIILAVAALMIAGPWGVGSTDLFGWLRLPVTGFEIGGITISPVGVLSAIALVAVGFALTHAVQRWLDRDLLPKTRMDEGLKASINTGVGYLGTIAIIMVALAYLGFSLDRLAIVAGALSVGIGFGLQAVISNFVSGVILLAERPIKAGDWIVIGSDQGNVRRISVRSTEIELFDRSTLIVPNSDFITKSVKNVTHGAPNGRVQIDLAVSSAVDPEEVKRVAIETAKAHSSVLAFPEPQILFTSLGKADNAFSLFCNVPSPRQAASVKSDLNFALVKAFADAGIALAGPPPPDMTQAVDRVAEALGLRGAASPVAATPKPHDASDAPPQPEPRPKPA